jgi:hypothetical protein
MKPILQSKEWSFNREVKTSGGCYRKGDLQKHPDETRKPVRLSE